MKKRRPAPMKTELVGQMTNNFSSFSLAVIIIFQWAAGSSSSEDVFLFQILQQKMSCGKNYMKSNPCWLLACVGLSFCKGVGDLTERSRRVFFFSSFAMTRATSRCGIRSLPFYRHAWHQSYLLEICTGASQCSWA